MPSDDLPPARRAHTRTEPTWQVAQFKPTHGDAAFFVGRADRPAVRRAVGHEAQPLVALPGPVRQLVLEDGRQDAPDPVGKPDPPLGPDRSVLEVVDDVRERLALVLIVRSPCAAVTATATATSAAPSAKARLSLNIPLASPDQISRHVAVSHGRLNLLPRRERVLHARRAPARAAGSGAAARAASSSS